MVTSLDVHLFSFSFLSRPGNNQHEQGRTLNQHLRHEIDNNSTTTTTFFSKGNLRCRDISLKHAVNVTYSCSDDVALKCKNSFFQTSNLDCAWEYQHSVLGFMLAETIEERNFYCTQHHKKKLFHLPAVKHRLSCHRRCVI